MHAMRFLLTLGVLATLAGCAQTVTPFADGSPDAGTRDVFSLIPDVTSPDIVLVDTPPPVDVQMFVPAMHEPFPPIPDQGGNRIGHPQIVVITYADDPNRDEAEAYNAWMAHSTWLTAVGREYGITGADVLANVRFTTNAPTMTSSAEIERFLANGIQNGTLPRPMTALGDALYVVYFPATTTITLTSFGQTSTSCVEFAGYHESFAVGTETAAYAAIPSCPDSGMDPTQLLEVSTSHELIEAATDAHPDHEPAFQFAQDSQSAWLVLGGEVADLCIGEDYIDGTRWAARVWSNAAALAGTDPCIPIDPTRTYFNVSSSPDQIRVAAAGDTVTFPIVGWSTGRVADWTLQLAPTGTLMAPMRVTPTRMNNGRTGTVTVNVPRDAPSGSYVGVLVYSMRSPSDFHVWPLAVIVQ